MHLVRFGAIWGILCNLIDYNSAGVNNNFDNKSGVDMNNFAASRRNLGQAMFFRMPGYGF